MRGVPGNLRLAYSTLSIYLITESYEDSQRAGATVVLVSSADYAMVRAQHKRGRRRQAKSEELVRDEEGMTCGMPGDSVLLRELRVLGRTASPRSGG